MSRPTLCPCGSDCSYADCCGRYHRGETPADAEALMRSRYSAYVLGASDYLLQSWHPSTRPTILELAPIGTLRWLGLSVKRYQLRDADHATVEFVARSRSGGGSAMRQHELSRFVREGGRWYYLDGEQLAEPQRSA